MQTIRPGQGLLYRRRLGCSRARLRVNLWIMPAQEWRGLFFYDQSVLGMKAGQHSRPPRFYKDFLKRFIAVLIGKNLAYSRRPGCRQLIDISRPPIKAKVYQRAMAGNIQLLCKGSGVQCAGNGVGLVDYRGHAPRGSRRRAAGPVLFVIGPRIAKVYMSIDGTGQDQHAFRVDSLLGPVRSAQRCDLSIFDPDVYAHLPIGCENPAVFYHQIKVYIQTSAATCASPLPGAVSPPHGAKSHR